MIGARHWGGSTISNGGATSPSNRVIVGRRPFHPAALEASILPQRRSFYERIVDNHNCSAKGKTREKILTKPEGSPSARRKTPRFIDLRRIPVQK
jgi:hypothetical protein